MTDELLRTMPAPEKLKLADWLVIASAINFDPMWAYYQWIDFSHSLGKLNLPDWEAIAVALGQPENWAYYRYKEYYAPAASDNCVN